MNTKYIQNQRLKLHSSVPFTPTYVKSSLIQSTDPAGTYASRVRGRQILLENPARESRAKKERNEKRIKQRAEKEWQKLRVMGKREAKERGVWRLDEAQTKLGALVMLRDGLTDLIDSNSSCPCITSGWVTCLNSLAFLRFLPTRPPLQRAKQCLPQQACTRNS